MTRVPEVEAVIDAFLAKILKEEEEMLLDPSLEYEDEGEDEGDDDYYEEEDIPQEETRNDPVPF